MSRLREVEVTVLVPEKWDAVVVAHKLLMSLAGEPKDWAIHVKVCAIEEEAEENEAR